MVYVYTFIRVFFITWLVLEDAGSDFSETVLFTPTDEFSSETGLLVNHFEEVFSLAARTDELSKSMTSKL